MSCCLAGVMLNKIFPDWMLALLLTLLLGFLTNRVLRRGLRMWRAESAERARAQGAAAGRPAAGMSSAAEDSQARPPAVHANGVDQPAAKAAGAAGAVRAHAGSEVGAARPPSALHRAASAAALVAFWAAFAGAQAGKALVEPCSLAFWGLLAAQARRPRSCALLCSGGHPVQWIHVHGAVSESLWRPLVVARGDMT